MTAKLSPLKVSRIMSLYFAGWSQSWIAQKLKINQATVSLHVTQFETLVKEYGLEAVAKEYGIMDEVKVLHSFGAELKAAKRTVEEARAGLKMVMLFQSCGVEEEDYQDLVQACHKMKSDETAKAAVELAQLEKATGKSWEGIVAEASNARKALEETKAELAGTTAELKASQAGLAATAKKKSLAYQDLSAHLKKVAAEKKEAGNGLAAHMKKLGLDIKRLALVEPLAEALKEGSVPNTDIGEYVRRQKYLDNSGVTLESFVEMLKQAKVMTAEDGGQALAHRLSEFGGLDAAVKTAEEKLSLLKQETDGLEEKAKLKAQLETDVLKLKAERAGHESAVAELTAMEKRLSIVQHDIADLTNKQQSLELDLKEKLARRSHLDEEIAEKEHKVAGLSQLEGRRDAVLASLAELETTKKLETVEREVFESFLGIVGSSLSAQAMENFLALAPELIALARSNGYKPESMRSVIIKDLSGGTLEILRCSSCEARFYVDKPVQDLPMGRRCVRCGSSLVATDAAGPEIIKKALAALTPKVVMVTTAINQKGGAPAKLSPPTYQPV